MALVPKRGIIALARAACVADQIVPCRLFIAHSEVGSRATISLQFSTYIHGLDQEQLFELVYDADNLVPGKTSLKPESEALSPVEVQAISRHGNGDLYSVSLSLKRPCVVKCPPYPGNIAPKHPSDPCFRQLVALAKETEVQFYSTTATFMEATGCDSGT